MVNNTDCGPNSTFKKCSLKVEADRNSASVSVSAPKVGKWPLSAEFRFRPKAASYLSVFLRFRPKLTLTFGHQPKVYFNFRNATLVLRLLGLAYSACQAVSLRKAIVGVKDANTHVCASIYIRMYVYIYIYMYIV